MITVLVNFGFLFVRITAGVLGSICTRKPHVSRSCPWGRIAIRTWTMNLDGEQRHFSVQERTNARINWNWDCDWDGEESSECKSNLINGPCRSICRVRELGDHGIDEFYEIYREHSITALSWMMCWSVCTITIPWIASISWKYTTITFVPSLHIPLNRISWRAVQIKGGSWDDMTIKM